MAGTFANKNNTGTGKIAGELYITLLLLLLFWLYALLLGPGRFFNFLILHTQSTGILGTGISPPQGRYLHRTTQTE
jgi:hypothetical protein